METFTNQYLIDKHRILSKDEERELIKKWQVDGDIRDRNTLLECNRRFIVTTSISLHRRYYWVKIEDIIGYGVCGFIDALGKDQTGKFRFDLNKNVRLITFAVTWVRRHIQRGCEDNETNVRIPANRWEQMRKKVKDKKELDQNEVVWIENAIHGVGADDTVGGHDSTMTIAEKYSYINHEQAVQQDNELHTSICNEALLDAIKSLSPVEQDIVNALFGLDGGGARTLREAGEEIHISHERVRQIRTASFKKLRKHFARSEIALDDIIVQ